MTFAQTWLRQSFGAAGASLLAPLAILVAAGALAASGGLGGLSGLGQITSGPTLPGSDLATGGGGIDQADIVGAEVVAPTAAGGAPSGVAVAGAPGTTGGGTTGAPLGGDVGSPLLDVPTSPGGGAGGSTPTPSPVQLPGAPPAPDPVGQVLDQTRGGLPALPEPIGPVSEDILNLLLGPPPE